MSVLDDTAAFMSFHDLMPLAAWFCSTCVGLLSLFSCAFSHLHALHGLTFTRCLNCAIEVLPRGRLSTAGRDCRTHVVGYSLHLVSALESQGILILLTTVCTRAWQSFLSTVSFLEDAGCSQSVRSGASACALGRFFWAVGSSNGYSHGSLGQVLCPGSGSQHVAYADTTSNYSLQCRRNLE